MRILDVGCSHGGWVLLFRRILKAEEAYGVDISEDGVKIANEKGVKAFKVDLNSESFPFKDAFFEIVFLMEVIEHLVNPDNCLREINRVLKHSGVLVMTTPNLASFVNRIVLLGGYQPYFAETSLECAEGYFFGKRYRHTTSGHLRLYTLKGLKGLLLDHGFQVVHAFGVPSVKNVPKTVLWVDRVLRRFPSLTINMALYARKELKEK